MMKTKLVKKLEKFLLDEDNSEFTGKPATDEQISNAEDKLGVKFSDDYIEFIKLFGGAYAGIEIRAFDNAACMGKESVVDFTLALRTSHPEVQDTYVISDDGSGNPIMMNQHGEVIIYYHDSGESETLALSLGEYIEDVFEPW
jgi:cell wall assembly regulator SMI1